MQALTDFLPRQQPLLDVGRVGGLPLHPELLPPFALVNVVLQTRSSYVCMYFSFYGDHGCQIVLGTIYQNGGKIDIPNYHKITKRP
jgi:hypothetical protein